MSIHRSNSSAVVLAASVAAVTALIAAGCGKSDSDAGAAPYGAPASPSAAPSTAGSPSSAPSTAAENVGPDTPTPSAFPSSAPAGTDKGADVTAPPIPAGNGAVPTMGMGGSPTAPLTATPELDAKIAAAEKSGNKPGIAAAYAERGTYRMNDPDAGARVKYRAALQDYRKALAADPTNAEAKNNKDLIEGIYKQMGRPIPE